MDKLLEHIKRQSSIGQHHFVKLPKVEQLISVAGNETQQITLVLDLSKKEDK